MGKHKKKSSKSHKKDKKHKRKCDTSSSDEWVEAELVNNVKNCKAKKKSSKKKKRYHSSSESSVESDYKKSRNDSSTSSDEEYNQGRTSEKKVKQQNNDTDTNEKSVVRDEWMSLSTTFSSLSNEDRRNKREQDKKLQKKLEQYDPRSCSRELNPYWKDGGDGLPKFLMPKDSVSDDERSYKTKVHKQHKSSWRKETNQTVPVASTSTDNKSYNEPRKEDTGKSVENKASYNSETEDLNVLAGKILKAEIMGNETLVEELKKRLEIARKSSKEALSSREEVLLTQTDSQGRTKPVIMLNDGASGSGKKQRKKAVDTHQDKQRSRYFPDDDKYSLQQMFENEKFNNADEQDKEFLKVASKINKNDDMDDFFTDNVRRKKSDSTLDENNRNKAIIEHKRVSDSLDNCSRCIQSKNMPKNLIISMGEYVYLGLPEHEPLTDGHCLIVPIRHVCSITHLDENEWSEILDFRKALVRLFCSKDQDVIFFESALGFHKYPHTLLECIPLPKEEGDMAPIYFKKAIDESEMEWAQNKKLVSLKGRNVRKAVPKGLPYFSVSFGMEEGYAHVVEDEQLFPRNFAQEIIGGMLDLHHSKWRKPIKQSFSDQSKRVLSFTKEWKSFDCTIKE
ncbi:CWF19-like protein 2 homolog [Sitophilus oryzae]|uniref:CWF19-like protein 2 homolog n=1 Tax=Sitophilus oryzae TaxID=7048 RepID=A0A6J2X458_SITOR|nr:CWF19-like protein 2 homolog [Sitophilus oryzae]